MAQQKVTIKVPKDLSPDERLELAEEIIEFIKLRTENGTGYRAKTGRNYKLGSVPYSKQYATKKGVGRRSVDLSLSTEMLNSIELLNHRSGAITVGYEAGTEVNGKAEGNQVGSYGRSPNPRKARPFLGISSGDLQTLIDRVTDDS